MNDHLFYLPLSADSELRIHISHCEYNGIDSDPRVIETAPGFGQLLRLCASQPAHFRTESQFSFFAPSAPAETTIRPGLAGGSEAFPAAPAPDGGTLRICTDKRPFSEWPDFALESTPFDLAQLEAASRELLQMHPPASSPPAFEFFQGHGEFAPYKPSL